MSQIASVCCALPARSYKQDEITSTFAEVVLGGAQQERIGLLRRLHESTTVRSRHLSLPLEQYPELSGFGQANDAFIRVGCELGEHAVRAALDRAGLRADEIDLIVTVSVTGIAAPSLDARLVPRLGLRTDVKRLPVFGLGCVAGAAGIARVHDYLAGHPDGVAVLLAVELCSLTLQRADISTAHLVASGLFGDGAAAVVMLGQERAERLGLGAEPAGDRAGDPLGERALAGAGPRVLATRSRFYPDTESVMGWQIGDSGFRIVLEPTVADVVERYLADDVRGFLGDHDLTIDQIDPWVAHPGGPKVIDAITAALGLAPRALDVTRACLSETGNLSSVSVLQVLERTMAVVRPVPGQLGLLLAMGPGFCSELVLLQW